jgi:uncharacterized protein
VVVVDTETGWLLSFDPDKRDRTLAGRGLDFIHSGRVFNDLTVEFEDSRRDYGERRILCYGRLEGRLVAIVYTLRGQARHIVSMRKANEREKARIDPLLEARSRSH